MRLLFASLHWLRFANQLFKRVFGFVPQSEQFGPWVRSVISPVIVGTGIPFRKMRHFFASYGLVHSLNARITKENLKDASQRAELQLFPNQIS